MTGLSHIRSAVPTVYSKKLAITAPVNGKTTSLSSVDNPLYAAGAWGPGHAVVTASSQVITPLAGVIALTDPLDYAVIVNAENGVRMKIKLGDNTGSLLGEKCFFNVKKGDAAGRNAPLMTFSPAWLKQQHVEPVCLVTLLNADKARAVVPTDRSQVTAGEDVLFTLYV
ncbi:PTS sugar transporter subunit IIA [Alteromonas sp. CYL-A6]|uniref:PTS sugar transporter subunit IIA n=1 Tax=Alteromonas nitratireducens TaxID=3390813 RepID=UPI0034BADBF1